ncbi:hypothetical protein GCM10028771_31990 [Nocardioides marmoraquaticus]
MLAAAARAFAERGWSGTHLDDLEQELGLVPGRATRLAGSKAELLWQSMAHASRTGPRTLEQVVADLRLDDLATVDERLDAIVALACRMHRAIAPFVPAIAEGSLVDPTCLAMRQGSDLRRLAVSRGFVALLVRGDAPLPDAAEVVQVMIMSETYATFTRNGWSMGRYAAWLRATIDRCVSGDLAGAG